MMHTLLTIPGLERSRQTNSWSLVNKLSLYIRPQPSEKPWLINKVNDTQEMIDTQCCPLAATCICLNMRLHTGGTKPREKKSAFWESLNPIKKRSRPHLLSSMLGSWYRRTRVTLLFLKKNPTASRYFCQFRCAMGKFKASWSKFLGSKEKYPITRSQRATRKMNLLSMKLGRKRKVNCAVTPDDKCYVHAEKVLSSRWKRHQP